MTCSVDSGLWCWDASTQAASDDAPSQRRGWRGVFSFFFEVGVRQGRVTLPCKSLRGVRAPNNRLPIFRGKMAAAILWSFTLPVGWHHRLRRRSCDSGRQPHYSITCVVGTWMTFYTMSLSSKAHAGRLSAARCELSPWPSTATVATWERRFGASVHCGLGIACPQ